MRDDLISRNAVIDMLTRRIGTREKALHEVMALIPECVKAGRYGDVAELATVAIGYSYSRCAYREVLRVVKSMRAKDMRGEVERA